MTKHRPIALLLALSMLLLLPILAPATSGNQVSGYIFSDDNFDGMPNDNEKRLSGAEVALVRSDGQAGEVLSTQVTQEDGSFLFPGIVEGDYFLRVLLPGNLVATTLTEGGSMALPSAGQSTQTPVFHFSNADISLPIGAVKKTGFVKVIAFGDDNANGGRFSTEPLLRDVLIEVVYEHEGQQYTIGSAFTDKDGEAFVREITPGTYRIAATVPDPYIIGPLGAKVNPFYNVIVPEGESRGLSEPLEIPQGGSVGVGASGVLTGKAQGALWSDTNMDGKRNSDEPGFPGVKLTLTNTQTKAQRAITTDNGGNYLFEKLQEGTYQLTVELPEDSMFTLPGESLFSDGFSRLNETELQVKLGEITTIQPVGVMPITSLNVHAFHDQNINGLLDEGEPSFAGATAEILSQGKVVATQVTNAEGHALFPVVRGGSLEVRVTLPEGQIFTIPADNGNLFSGKTASNKETAAYTLPHGTRGELLAGVTLPSAITGQLFDDSNLNGIYDKDELFLSGFTVEALDKDQAVVATATTDEKGRYTLSNLIPNTYTVRIGLQSPFIFSAPSNTGAQMENKIVAQTPSFGETAAIEVQPGESLGNIDAGVFRSAIINGSVLLGDGNDGFSGQLGGLENVRIELLDEEGTPVSDYTIATTDANGAFSLKGALPDTYTLRYTLPEGAAFSRPHQEDAIYVTAPFVVKSSDVLEQEALYAVKTASLSGKAFSDLNADGLFGEGDAPLVDTTINLTTEDSTVITQKADHEGGYRFDKLRPGAYKVEVVLPEGNYISYTEKSLVPAALSNQSHSTLTLDMGEQADNLDIAASPAAALHVTAYYDNDLNRAFGDTDSPYQFSAFTLTHEKTGETFDLVSDEKGATSLPEAFYGTYRYSITLPEDHIIYAPEGAQQSGGTWQGTFQILEQNAVFNLGLAQYGSFSGTVWNLGGGNDNVSGVAVSLVDAQSNQQVASASTNGQGEFRFNSLLPGQYILKARLNAGFRYARSLDTAMRPSIIISDGGQVSNEVGQSDRFELKMGEHKTQQDIGMGATGKLGDIAWLDLDQDGMQDTDEPGIPGLTIRLYQYGQLAAETTTDAYGRYLFHELYPGAYTLEVEMPQELKTTKQQTTFPLVASVFPTGQEGTARAEGVMVPSKARNLNCDLGFALKTPGRYPANMQMLPSKDWTPLVPYTPTR